MAEDEPRPSVRGRLLLGGPQLFDPNFFRSVVLVLDHDDNGAFGLVVNRRSDIPLLDVLERWAPYASPDARLFVGGPVSPDVGIGLAVTAAGDVAGVRPVVGGWSLIDLDADAAIVGPQLRSLRVFSGYAGWGPGQLDAELAAGGWIVLDAQLDDPFDDEPQELWSRALRRQRGPLSWLANYPVEPRLN